MDDIDKILKNSSKAELLERLGELLETYGKAIVVLIEDREEGEFASQVMTMNVGCNYEAYGILEVAKQDLMKMND